MARRVFGLLLAGVFFLLAGCSANVVSDTSFVMDTFLSQSFSGSEEIATENNQIVSRIEKEMSKTLEGTDIYNLNAQGLFQVCDDTAAVIRTAIEIADATDGAFNPALGRLIDLWGISGDGTGKVPAAGEIEALLPYCDYLTVQITDDNTVSLAADSALDLGGIAKGYALDKLTENLRKNRIDSALIDLGGSLAVVGKKTNGQKFKIGVRDPLGEESEFIATVEMEDAFTSTSGVYERYFIQDGVRYHHILDPRTGYPASPGLLSVMIVSDSGILSDAYSTALFVMGAEKGIRFANENGIDALFITEDKKITMTDGFAEKYNFQLVGGYEVV